MRNFNKILVPLVLSSCAAQVSQKHFDPETPDGYITAALNAPTPQASLQILNKAIKLTGDSSIFSYRYFPLKALEMDELAKEDSLVAVSFGSADFFSTKVDIQTAGVQIFKWQKDQSRKVNQYIDNKRVTNNYDLDGFSEISYGEEKLPQNIEIKQNKEKESAEDAVINRDSDKSKKEAVTDINTKGYNEKYGRQSGVSVSEETETVTGGGSAGVIVDSCRSVAGTYGFIEIPLKLCEAELQYSRKDFALARSTFKEVVKKYSDYSSLAYIGMARCDGALGKFRRARRLLFKSIKVNPIPRAYAVLGYVYNRLGKPQKELAALQQATQMGYRNSHLLRYRIEDLQSLLDVDK